MSSISELTAVALSNKSNLVYSVLILINSFAYGINSNILGATLDDLRFVYGASLSTMSYVPLATGLGYLVGALAGWLYRWINRQLVLSILVLLLALTIGLIPYYGSIGTALVFLFMNGLGDGAWDASSDYWIIEMWPVGHAAMLQLMQFMYGAGAVVAPLLAAPYIQGEDAGRNITVGKRISSLALPFAITGILQAIVPTFLLLLFITNRYKPNSNKPQDDTQKCIDLDEQPIPHRTLKLTLCGISFAAYASAELNWFNFSSTMYQRLEGTELAASDAARILALLFVTYALGRLVTAFLTLKLSPDVIIMYHFVLINFSFAFQYFSRTNLTLITIANAFLGYGFSAMIPSLLAFTEKHLKLSERICSMYTFGLGMCSLIIPLIMGQTFDEEPILLCFLVGCFVFVSFITFMCVRFLIKFDKNLKNNLEYVKF